MCRFLLFDKPGSLCFPGFGLRFGFGLRLGACSWSLLLSEKTKQLADRAARLEVMAQRLSVVDPIPVSPTVLADFEESFVLEVANDLLDGSLRDANLVGHVTQARTAVACQADQHMAVVAEKRPIAHHLISKSLEATESGTVLRINTMNDISCLIILQ